MPSPAWQEQRCEGAKSHECRRGRKPRPGDAEPEVRVAEHRQREIRRCMTRSGSNGEFEARRSPSHRRGAKDRGDAAHATSPVRLGPCLNVEAGSFGSRLLRTAQRRQ